MKANSFIRAVVSIAFGALLYIALTVNSSSEAANELQHKVETHKVAVLAKAPSAVRTAQGSTERFVATTVPTPAPFPSPSPSVKKVETLASERARKLQVESDRIDQQAKIEAAKAKIEAEKRAKAKVELARKVKAEKERKKKEEKARKEKVAKKAAQERVRMRGVPVPGAVIGATFGARGPWAKYHTGLDFRAGQGTVIKAVAPGRIIYAGNSGDWAGNHVVIKHVSGKKTLYAHMSSISKTGGRVHAGDKIGQVGSTGRAFGAHLHLELYPAGARPGDVYRAVDPRPWLRARGIRLG